MIVFGFFFPFLLEKRYFKRADADVWCLCRQKHIGMNPDARRERTDNGMAKRWD